MTRETGTPERTDFGVLLRELRQQAGLALQELAEATGIGTRTLAALEDGHDAPRPSTVELMAAALRLPAPISETLWQVAHRRWLQSPGHRGRPA
ncbi:helix-turn-helix domain-containing protein [Peterkaempfera griseoplana]|uniref:helix-turn-helix domain-containing protein n=1 Tax=Peterkaempfera griseoplana TaxID=66896 RepID=UPI0006E325A9|nr:helix-turn-helix transcriptional regulator [Peterkaempfera griseoplana]